MFQYHIYSLWRVFIGRQIGKTDLIYYIRYLINDTIKISRGLLSSHKAFMIADYINILTYQIATSRPSTAILRATQISELAFINSGHAMVLLSRVLRLGLNKITRIYLKLRLCCKKQNKEQTVCVFFLFFNLLRFNSGLQSHHVISPHVEFARRTIVINTRQWDSRAISEISTTSYHLQYIPRNMHTVLLCFALLWLCNRS